MSNLRIPTLEAATEAASIARAWPGIEANVAELQQHSRPEPSIWTVPGERMPEIVRERRAPSIAASLALLEIGQARIVYSVRKPVFFMRQAEALAGAYEATSAPDHGKNAWIVERLA